MIVLRSLIKKNVDHTFKNFLSVLLIARALDIQDHKKLQNENQYIKKPIIMNHYRPQYCEESSVSENIGK